MPEEGVDADETNICYYFARTATCRNYGRCAKSHPRPTLSSAILIPNFFSHFKLEQAVRDEYDSDLGLEYEDKELYSEFLEFYDDVVPELRKSGTVIQFKACCNLEPHLRGNVYVQYQTIREAIEAFRKFNGRFYNGRQLSLQFIKMDSWRSAICGAFLRKACVKGRSCSFLHVFRNPTKEFVKADHDWKEYQRATTAHSWQTSNPAMSTPTNPNQTSHQLTSTPVHVPQQDQLKKTDKPRKDGINSKKNGRFDQDTIPSSSSSHSQRNTKSNWKSDSSKDHSHHKNRTKHKYSKSSSTINEKESRKRKHKTDESSLSLSSTLSPKKKKRKKSKSKKDKKHKKEKKSKKRKLEDLNQ